MISVREPDDSTVCSLLRLVATADFSYSAVGWLSRRETPAGFRHDSLSTELGCGDAVWSAACDAISRWTMFPASMVRLVHLSEAIEVGSVVGVVARAAGIWTANPARIFEVINDQDERFGFTYGTLPGHVESGEERFLVERDPEGVVRYTIEAVSRPAHPLVWLGYPLARWMQAKFRGRSAAAMTEFVQGVCGSSSVNG